MKKVFLVPAATVFLSMVSNVYALEGLTLLEKKLLEKNQDFQSLQLQAEAKQALNTAAASGYYPTLNLVGGWGQNKTDDLSNVEKGYLGYAEGRLNLFRGFKDQSTRNLKNNDLERARNELEFKKRELRTQLTEVASDMILLHKMEEILKEEYKITQTQKQMAAKKVAAGLTSNVDNIEFELRESELQIEQRRINQQHLEAHQKFHALLGVEIADAELQNLDFSAPDILIKDFVPASPEKTIEYKNAELIQAQSDLEKAEIKSEFFPSLDFIYSVGRLTPSEANPIEFDESRYSLLVTIPLFSGFDTYYKTKAANQLSQSAERLKYQRRNEITATINTAKTKLSELSALLKINEKKLVSSQKYFDLTLSEYRRGVKNSPDLVGATERLFSARKQKFEILKDLELLKVHYERFN